MKNHSIFLKFGSLFLLHSQLDVSVVTHSYITFNVKVLFVSVIL